MPYAFQKKIDQRRPIVGFSAPPQAIPPSHRTHRCVAWRLDDLATQGPQWSQLPSKGKLALSRHVANLGFSNCRCFAGQAVCLDRDFFGEIWGMRRRRSITRHHHHHHHHHHQHHHHQHWVIILIIVFVFLIIVTVTGITRITIGNSGRGHRGCSLHPSVHGVIRWRIMRKLLVGECKRPRWRY